MVVLLLMLAFRGSLSVAVDVAVAVAVPRQLLGWQYVY